MAVKRVENLLNPNNNGDLANLVRRAKDMGDLAAALARVLPPEDRASIIAANVRDDGELVILCRSPAWAARLRFAADTLLDAARTHGSAATHCSVRVARSE